MKFAIYGVSRSGKDYFIDALTGFFSAHGERLYHVKGSETLDRLAAEVNGVKFAQCDDAQKNDLRRRFVELIDATESEYKYVVVDGHYSFFGDGKTLYSVCTRSDICCYDKFFYLDVEPQQVVERMRNSSGSKHNEILTEDDVRCWQDSEIDRLSEELLANDKELHIIRYENESALQYVFDCVTKNEFNSRVIAKSLVDKLDLTGNCVILTDCDKTLSREDSTNLAFEYFKQTAKVLKEIFKNDRYSNYQVWQAGKYIDESGGLTEESMTYAVDNIKANQALIDDLLELRNIPIVGITAGNGTLWDRIVRKFGLRISVMAHERMLVSKYVKYFAVKELQARGMFVIAIGDSLLDGLMLKHANKGYIVTAKGYRENIADFLAQNNTVKQLDYFPVCYPDVAHERSVTPIKTLTPTESIAADIAVCKSDSSATGKRLRDAHYRLGEQIAGMIESDFKNDRFAVISVMRSGLPFSLGIADRFDCPVLFFEDNNITSLERQLCDNPQLTGHTFIICDAVINSGKTIEALIARLGDIKCIVATNVLSDKCSMKLSCPIYAVRISTNSFVGAKQKNVAQGKGPDTGDRLFKLL